MNQSVNQREHSGITDLRQCESGLLGILYDFQNLAETSLTKINL